MDISLYNDESEADGVRGRQKKRRICHLLHIWVNKENEQKNRIIDEKNEMMRERQTEEENDCEMLHP